MSSHTPQVSVDGEMIKVALLFTDELSLADLKVSTCRASQPRVSVIE